MSLQYNGNWSSFGRRQWTEFCSTLHHWHFDNKLDNKTRHGVCYLRFSGKNLETAKDLLSLFYLKAASSNAQITRFTEFHAFQLGKYDVEQTWKFSSHSLRVHHKSLWTEWLWIDRLESRLTLCCVGNLLSGVSWRCFRWFPHPRQPQYVQQTVIFEDKIALELLTLRRMRLKISRIIHVNGSITVPRCFLGKNNLQVALMEINLQHFICNMISFSFIFISYRRLYKDCFTT